jgi:hypothetical protein
MRPEANMTQNDLQQIRLGYLRGVLAERWPVPSRGRSVKLAGAA